MTFLQPNSCALSAAEVIWSAGGGEGVGWNRLLLHKLGTSKAQESVDIYSLPSHLKFRS